MGKQIIACDLDGTLAKYDKWVSVEHIGELIPEVAAAIDSAQRQGDDVWIFTARVSDPEEAKVAGPIIHKWLVDNGIQFEGITAVKHKFFTQFWDDRALQVIKNQGIFVINPAQLDTDDMPTAPIFLPDDSSIGKDAVLEQVQGAVLENNDSALAVQEGGNHYKRFKIQPVEFAHANKMPFLEANAFKYICRHSFKNGIEDLRKARHYLELIAELEYKEKL